MKNPLDLYFHKSLQYVLPSTGVCLSPHYSMFVPRLQYVQHTPFTWCYSPLAVYLFPPNGRLHNLCFPPLCQVQSCEYIPPVILLHIRLSPYCLLLLCDMTSMGFHEALYLYQKFRGLRALNFQILQIAGMGGLRPHILSISLCLSPNYIVFVLATYIDV